MKKLLLIFALLLAVAVAATVAGVLLGRKGGGSGAGDATVLVWHLDGPVLEQEVPRLPFSGERELGSLAKLYPGLRAARRDPGVRGLAVYIQDADFGLARAQELRRQMMALRRAGKFVECYLETAGEGSNGTLAYYLATACERIHLAPAGDLNLLGLALREPLPPRRPRQAEDRARFPARRPLQERSPRPIPRPHYTPEARGGHRRGARQLLLPGVSPPSPRRARRASTRSAALIDGAPYDAQDGPAARIWWISSPTRTSSATT